MQQPLAERMRPTTLAEIVGQDHLTGPDSLLQQSLRSGYLPSMLLWGPPGVGKTTLANIVAKAAGHTFFQLSAINAGVKDIREVIEAAQKLKQAVLFIDEIHRFNKSQQDALLGAVEKGTIILIGATTENPSFEVNAALLSRAQVYVLKALSREDLTQLALRALQNDPYLAPQKLQLAETEALFRLSGGDGRKLLNLLEMVATQLTENGIITNEMVMRLAQQKVTLYDKQGEQHYDIISAFIKSIRGSDPQAAVYWLARMLEGGEDILFIARRMIILATEDIGLANPNALLLANATFDAVHKIGMPEARIPLSNCAIYLATSPKSNSTYKAIDAALAIVKKTGDLPVPLHLRNAPTKLMKELGYGNDYQYAHDFPDNFIAQPFLPDALQGQIFFEPGNNEKEKSIRQWLLKRWQQFYHY